MKIAITGHTKGIGRAFAELFEREGHEVVGFSKSQGWDIYDESVQEKIINSLDDCEVFVNNAYMPWAQSNLTKLAYNKWQGTDKTIVVINSKLGMLEDPPKWARDYANDKRLQTYTIHKNILKASPRVFNVILGLVETDMSKGLKGQKMNPNHIAQLVYDLLKYKDSIYVQEIVLDVPRQNWSDIDVELA